MLFRRRLALADRNGHLKFPTKDKRGRAHHCLSVQEHDLAVVATECVRYVLYEEGGWVPAAVSS